MHVPRFVQDVPELHMFSSSIYCKATNLRPKTHKTCEWFALHVSRPPRVNTIFASCLKAFEKWWLTVSSCIWCTRHPLIRLCQETACMYLFGLAPTLETTQKATVHLPRAIYLFYDFTFNFKARMLWSNWAQDLQVSRFSSSSWGEHIGSSRAVYY